MHNPRCVIINKGGGGVRQNTTVLYLIYYVDDDMFRPLWATFRSQKKIYRERERARERERGKPNREDTRQLWFDVPHPLPK